MNSKFIAAMVEQLEALGFTVFEPGANIPVATGRVHELIEILYARGEELEFNFAKGRELFSKYSDIYEDAFEMLDLDDLVNGWSEDSLRKVSGGGKVIQMAPSLLHAKQLRKAALRRYRQLRGPVRRVSDNGMDEQGRQRQ